jgi:gliding motility-associated-like protein
MVLIAPNSLVGELAVTPPNCGDVQSGSLRVEAVSGGTAPYLYALDEGAYSPDNLFTGVAAGTHTVSVQDANGCSWELTALMEPAPELTVDLGEDLELSFGDSLRLVAIPSGPVVRYQWSGGPISSCDTCANPLVSPRETTTYAVVVTDENNCTATDVIQVFVRKAHEFFIPNAFSPDGDGFNDRFGIYGGAQLVSIRTLKVFNRWGTMVYEAADLLPGEEARAWDGRQQGQALPAGVYVYAAELRFLDGTTQVFKGEILLMR